MPMQSIQKTFEVIALLLTIGRILNLILIGKNDFTGASKTGGVLSGGLPLLLFPPLVLFDQIQADRTDSEEEHTSANQKQDDSGYPKCFRFLWRRSQHHQDDADREDQTTQRTGQNAKVEVTFGRPRDVVVVT